jgi:GT2 family glycosyltransferase
MKFFSDLYLEMHEDLLIGKVDAKEHYLKHGSAEGRRPHPLIDVNMVKASVATGVDATKTLYEQFLASNTNSPFHPLVDCDYMRAQNPALKSSADCFSVLADPNKSLGKLIPHPLFDPAIYRTMVTNQKYKNELVDFLLNEPWTQVCPLFDPIYYAASGQSPLLGVPPLLHYLLNWASWERDPSPLFDAKYSNHILRSNNAAFLDSKTDPLSYCLKNNIDTDNGVIHPHLTQQLLALIFKADEDVPENSSLTYKFVNALQSLMVSPLKRSTKEPLLSIVILNYKKPAYTILSILSAQRALRGLDYEIILVDNSCDSSRFTSLHRLLKLSTDVNLRAMSENKFFGEGNNIGIDLAKGRFILFLNNDCFLAEDYGRELKKLLAHNADAHVVGAHLLFPDGLTQECGGIVSSCGQVIQRFKGTPSALVTKSDALEQVGYASAACLLVSRKALECVAGFDPLFEPFYYEDTDLCQRLVKAGFSIYLSTRLRAVHIENASTKEFLGASGMQSLIAKNKETFWKRWLGNSGRDAYISPPSSTGKKTVKRPHREMAVLYSPFDIRIGGGERYFLSAAQVLGEKYRIVLCLPKGCSRARVKFTLHAMGLKEFDFEIVSDINDPLVQTGSPTILFAMSNDLVPEVAAVAEVNLLHLQFPFPSPLSLNASRNVNALKAYDKIIVNSEYTFKWTEQRLREAGTEEHPPVVVVNPPVHFPLFDKKIHKKDEELHLINVGRFFVHGHTKKQDIFLEIVSRVRALTGLNVKATLVGGVDDDDDSRAYFAHIKQRAARLGNVELLLNASSAKVIESMFAANVFVHCAGFGSVEVEAPEKFEHFGLAVAEALRAQCIPVVYAAGGPLATVTTAGVGLSYKTVEGAAMHIAALNAKSERSRLLGLANASWIEGLTLGKFATELRKHA